MARVSIEEGAAFAAVSLAVVQTVNVYRDTAPSLRELRCSSPEDFASRQLVLDADLFGLIIVLSVGGGAAYLTKRMYPLVLSLMALLALSVFYRSVLRSPNVGMQPIERNDDNG